MKWMVLILVAMAIGAGPTTDQDTYARLKSSLSTADGMRLFFGIETRIDDQLPQTIKKMSPEIVGTGGDQALKVTIDATSTKDFEVALLAATAAVGMEKRFGAPFSNSEIEFKTPEGSATFIVPLLEAEALRGDDGKLSAPAFVAFSFAADYREIRHLAWQEEKFPTLKTAPQELERVIDAYLNQKANGQAVAKITISP